MEDLSLEDLKGVVVKVTPVDFMGKAAYIRNLTFDGQVLIQARFQERMKEDATADDMRVLICLVLCDKTGKLIFHPGDDETFDEAVERGRQMLVDIDGDDMQEIFNQAKEINGWDVEEEIKN